MPIDDCLDQRQTYAGAAGVALPGLVESDEPVKHPLPVGWGDACPVILNDCPHYGRRAHRGDLHLTRRMANGVLHDVEYRTLDLCAGAMCPNDPVGGDSDVDIGIVQPVCDLPAYRREIDSREIPPIALCVEPSQVQQVCCQILYSTGLGLDLRGQGCETLGLLILAISATATMVASGDLSS